MSRDVQSTCEACGATIFREQIENGLSRYEGGKLMCMHCVEEYESRSEPAASPASGYHLDPIALRDDEPARPVAKPAAASGMGTGGSGLGMPQPRAPETFRRPLDPRSNAASRCRTFHCKLNDSAIEFMNSQINHWLDDNPEITIKFATSTLGVFEGKSKEQNVILTLFF